MEINYEGLLTNKLFDKIEPEALKGLLVCLNAQLKHFRKNEVILHQQEPVKYMGIMIDGKIKIIKDGIDGNEYLLTELASGDLFLETYACMETTHSPVSVIAKEDCSILFLDFKKMMTTCDHSCVFHTHLIKNMMFILAQKNSLLNQKIEIISKRTLREKILCYFAYQSQGTKSFYIPLNRESLANTLCADRSAVSNELSKMQKEGLIRYHKNYFEIV